MVVQELEIGEGWEVVTDDKGLIKKIITEGEGYKKPGNGAKVDVHYTGRLISNGVEFDSSRKRNDPFSFTIGKHEVIKGWETGIPTMKKGEKAIFHLRSDYAYGANGSPPNIPGDSNLEFEVELISWASKEDVSDGKKKIWKKQITKAEGYSKPNDCAKVAIAFTAKVKGSEEVFDSATAENPFRFTVGEEAVFSGLEKAVKSLVKGEKAVFTIDPEFGFGAAGLPEKGVPANATLKYEIELVELEKEKETYKMENPEKIEFAKGKKEQGNTFFKNGKTSIAIKRYESAISAIKYTSDFSEDEKKQAEEIQVACEVNIAIANSKLKKWKEVITHADNALKLNPSNVKALFKKGVALVEKDDWDAGRAALNKVLELDPNNNDAKKEIAKINRKIETQNQKDKQLYKKMFQAL